MTQSQPSKNHNLILFIVLAFGVVMIHTWLFPPKKPLPKEEDKQVAAAKDHQADQGDKKDKEPAAIEADKKASDDKAEVKASAKDDKDAKDVDADDNDKDKVASETDETADVKPGDPARNLLPTDKPEEWVTLGSADPESPYAMLVTLTNRGAAVARVELNSPRYPQLMDDDGLLAERQGYLGRVVAGEPTRGKGCVVNVVGQGTPAEKAGMKPGDLIVDVNGQKVTGTASFLAAMRETKPKRTISVTVLRDGKEVVLKPKLTRPLIEVLRPEGSDPLSFLMTLSHLGDRELKEELPKKTVFPSRETVVPCPASLDKELKGLNLRTGNWTLVRHDETEAVFECELPNQNLKLTKTYRLAKFENADDRPGAYHLVLDVKLENLGKKTVEAAYQLDGPTGLPIEGWWYANKVGLGDCWTAGLRDVIVSLDGKSPTMTGCTAISDGSLDPPWKDEPLSYIGVDAQYFSCVMIPESEKTGDSWIATSQPLRVGPVRGTDMKRLTNVSCRMRSVTAELEPGKSIEHSYQIFAGPKAKDILEAYHLEPLVYYGWFSFAARPMVSILHFFHAIVQNYGLAIILLTVLVRGAMYPMSRKQALAAAKMAEIQPEIKKIQAKYKDLNERHKAQQELFKKYNYNPMAGCLVMFIQLPIFIGLYRGLMVDIELRGSSLLGSWVRWCSNLSAPDMLVDWSSWMHHWVTSGVGIFGLGPYFNLLPIVTIVLFIVQQKMMMPPAADEAQAMQQKMMKYMMIFMGLLFFKVASGLCIYFIASSLWGVAERKFLPKHPGKETTPQAEFSSARRRERKKK